MPRNQQPKEDPQSDTTGTDTPDTDTDATAAAAKGDVQEQADRDNEQGFVGVKVDPVPNEEYTLTTGPDSPSGVQHGERVEQVTRDEGDTRR